MLSRANTYRLINREDKNFAVAEFARARGFDDRFNRVFDDLFVNDDFDLQLRHEFDFVLAASIDLSVAFLPSEPFHLADGHALHAERLQRVLYAFEQMRADDRFYLFHKLASFPETKFKLNYVTREPDWQPPRTTIRHNQYPVPRTKPRRDPGCNPLRRVATSPIPSPRLRQSPARRQSGQRP